MRYNPRYKGAVIGALRSASSALNACKGASITIPPDFEGAGAVRSALSTLRGVNISGLISKVSSSAEKFESAENTVAGLASEFLDLFGDVISNDSYNNKKKSTNISDSNRASQYESGTNKTSNKWASSRKDSNKEYNQVQYGSNKTIQSISGGNRAVQSGSSINRTTQTIQSISGDNITSQVKSGTNRVTSGTNKAYVKIVKKEKTDLEKAIDYYNSSRYVDNSNTIGDLLAFGTMSLGYLTGKIGVGAVKTVDQALDFIRNELAQLNRLSNGKGYSGGVTEKSMLLHVAETSGSKWTDSQVEIMDRQWQSIVEKYNDIFGTEHTFDSLKAAGAVAETVGGTSVKLISTWILGPKAPLIINTATQGAKATEKFLNRPDIDRTNPEHIKQALNYGQSMATTAAAAGAISSVAGGAFDFVKDSYNLDVTWVPKAVVKSLSSSLAYITKANGSISAIASATGKEYSDYIYDSNRIYDNHDRYHDTKSGVQYVDPKDLMIGAVETASIVFLKEAITNVFFPSNIQPTSNVVDNETIDMVIDSQHVMDDATPIDPFNPVKDMFKEALGIGIDQVKKPYSYDPIS